MRSRKSYRYYAARICRICGDVMQTAVSCPAAAERPITDRMCFSCSCSHRGIEVDEVVVDRLVSGRRHPSTIAERRKAAAILLGKYGVSVRLAAERMGVDERSVARYKRWLIQKGELAA